MAPPTGGEPMGRGTHVVLSGCAPPGPMDAVPATRRLPSSPTSRPGSRGGPRRVVLCMENITRLTPLKQPIVFELEGFDVPPGYGSLLFILALFNLILVLLGNGVVAFVIIIDKNLHKPMFILVCHLVACDLLGSTAMLPRLMMHFLTGQKKITYALALTQALSVHTYGAAMQTILGTMAYDRYFAVCEPLRYSTIMTSARLHTYCAVAWIIALVLISVLFAFHINVELCGTTIKYVFCSNRSILALACSPTPINNIYGLFITWFISISVFLIVAFSYFRILHASVKRRRTGSSINSKAFRTCAIHIAVYLIHKVAVLVIVVTYRFPSASQNINKFLSILFIIIPPAVNPIIYGLASKELRESIIKHFSKVSHRK
ncbi:olfactory receptor 2K2-like [Antennarius striatus]|uniref:olfactory receptor 2K2-like n=1 Tax=Antennarius striatus TaxID=241820 RepID=UPI0035B24928